DSHGFHTYPTRRSSDLTGADVTEEGVTFRYEDRRQEGAVYNVYAGEDIVAAYGAKIYSKGDLVKGNLTTDDNGSAVLKNLHLGRSEEHTSELQSRFDLV